MASSRRRIQPHFNYNAIVTSVASAIILAVLFGIWSKGGDILTKVSGHDEAIKSIPEIKRTVEANATEAKTGLATLNTKVDGLVTRNELNAKQEKTDGALKEIKDTQKALEIKQERADAVRDALKQFAPPSPK